MQILAVIAALFLATNPIQSEPPALVEIEIEGQVSGVSGDTIVLFEGRVVVEAPGIPEAGELETGMGVSTEAVVDSGRLVARAVEIENNPESVIEGTVTEVDSNRELIRVGMISIALDADTEFENVAFESIEVGMEVEVEVRIEAGRIVASELEAE